MPTFGRRRKFRSPGPPTRAAAPSGTPEVCPDLTPIQPASAWAAAHLGFTPDPRQAEFLDLAHGRIVLCTSRQSGKTQAAAAKALHAALTFPGTLYLLFGPVARQSGNLLQRIRTFCHLLGLLTKSDPDHDNSVVLPNGSRFVALPGVPDPPCQHS